MKHAHNQNLIRVNSKDSNVYRNGNMQVKYDPEGVAQQRNNAIFYKYAIPLGLKIRLIRSKFSIGNNISIKVNKVFENCVHNIIFTI